MIEKPLTSFCLFAYNQEKYIEEAVRGALSQQYSPLEIIISDDCSTDKTYEIIKDLVSKYNGKSKVYINRNCMNLGLIPHVNKVFEDFVHGEFIVLAAGDDISLPDRTKQSVDLLEEEGIMCVSFNANYIDSKSNPLGKNLYSKTNSIDTYSIDDFISNYSLNIHGATKAVNRIVFNEFGPLNSNCPTEDSTLTFRGLLLGKIVVCYKSVLKYRSHENNLSGEISLFKLNYKEIAKQYRDDFIKYYRHNDSKMYQKKKEKILRRIDTYEQREAFKRICVLKQESKNIVNILIKILTIEIFSCKEKYGLFKSLMKSI